MEIRSALPSDAEGISKVLSQSYNIKDDSEGKEVFLSELKKGHHYIVAQKDGEIVGIVSWLPHGLPKHGLAELDRIALLPKERGAGTSRLLKDALVSEAKKWYESKGAHLRKLYLLTHEDNERARKFYEKMGLLHETTLKDHYYKGKGECVYSTFFEK